MDEQPQPRKSEILSPVFDAKSMESHIIADMLRIEALTSEVKEFKHDTKLRLDKIEGWVIGIVGVTVTTLIATVGSLLFKVIG